MERLSYKTDDERRAHCRSREIEPDDHCCLDMAWFISQPNEWPAQGPNSPILWVASWDEYRINIPRDGWASTPIRFCPWCGACLPESKADLWHQILHDRGYADPGNDEIPEEFNSDEWWRKWLESGGAH